LFGTGTGGGGAATWKAVAIVSVKTKGNAKTHTPQHINRCFHLRFGIIE